ncbi:MAG: hypothetical protein PHV74_01995, partial [Dehalococcoidia bacterium]|nr:hypothetical protein [Dehalococcoidia bacterium]
MELKPTKGGFLRPFGTGWFTREFLLGRAPYGSPKIHPDAGAPQADILTAYKEALIRTTAEDRAVREEERQAKREHRPFDPDNIEGLVEKHLHRIPYKSTGMRYHSFVTYFATLQRLGWVEATGREEPSAFQDYYPGAPPRKYFRLTQAGKQASDAAWRNPSKALYPQSEGTPQTDSRVLI